MISIKGGGFTAQKQPGPPHRAAKAQSGESLPSPKVILPFHNRCADDNPIAHDTP